LHVNGSLRVDGNTEPYLFFVDANTNRIGIGTNTPQEMLHLYSPTGAVRIEIESGDASSTVFKMTNSQSSYGFYSSTNMWRIYDYLSRTFPFTIADSSKTNSLYIRPSEVVINENSYDLNFRVESDNNVNMLFVDASTDRVGIGTDTPQRALHINDVMRLEPRASAPGSPSEGDIYYDSTLHVLRVYDGTQWQNCWPVIS